MIANAAQIAQVPVRKTDVKNGVWIAQLVEHGLVREAFAAAPIRELRDLTRYRAALIGEQTREINRLQRCSKMRASNWRRWPVTSSGAPGARCSRP